MALVDFLDPTVLAILEQPQPYNMSQPMEHALAELNKLANLDKQAGYERLRPARDVRTLCWQCEISERGEWLCPSGR